MQEQSEGLKELLAKLTILIPGMIIGLSAKLSKINRDRKLTWASGVAEFCTAFMTALVVHYLLEIAGKEKYQLPAAVLCGRYGDEIMRFVYTWAKNFIQTVLKSLK